MPARGNPCPPLVIRAQDSPGGMIAVGTIKRVSKPGRRLYTRSKELKPVLGGLGISIVSTSKGVISDREARQNNVGGEVLCEIA